MPKVCVNNLDHYYEQCGEGLDLVFVHGAFADARVWDPQWEHFSSEYRLLRYDLRGHGRSGPSDLDNYTINTFADDLTGLLDALEIHSAVICGLSWGGSIAQAFAVRNPARLRALIMAGSAVTVSLTMTEKLLRYVLFPRWAMLLTIRLLSVRHFTRFSLWLAHIKLGKKWLSRDEETRSYLEQCMLGMNSSEYLKIWAAIYAFDILPLERITCPTLVLNGEHEARDTYRHTEAILQRIPHATSRVVPAAFHASNRDNPEAFNRFMEEFLLQQS
jgi:3-oxoadipate enol-lactonase